VNENIDLQKFSVIIDNGTCFFDCYPVSFFSNSSRIAELLDAIEKKYEKTADLINVNQEELVLYIGI
jgi:hypothetical protein